MIIRIIVATTCILTSGQLAAQSAKDSVHLFTTWQGFELDKAACIWLIKRFIDKDAQFHLYPPQANIQVGLTFDTPTSSLRRTHRFATFERILAHYQIKDVVARRIGAYIHDIEINTWRKKRFVESEIMLSHFARLDIERISNDEFVNCAVDYFDRMYEYIQSNTRFEAFKLQKTRCKEFTKSTAP